MPPLCILEAMGLITFRFNFQAGEEAIPDEWILKSFCEKLHTVISCLMSSFNLLMSSASLTGYCACIVVGQ